MAPSEFAGVLRTLLSFIGCSTHCVPAVPTPGHYSIQDKKDWGCLVISSIFRYREKTWWSIIMAGLEVTNDRFAPLSAVEEK